MSTVDLTADTFEQAVTGNDIVLVDWWAAWCGPCRAFAPIFEAASETHKDIVFGKIDTDAQPELSGSFQIRSIPTLMIFRDGILLLDQPGSLPKMALEDLIRQVRGLDMDDVRRKIEEAEKAKPQA